MNYFETTKLFMAIILIQYICELIRLCLLSHDIIKGMKALCIFPYTVYSNNQADSTEGNTATDGLCIIRSYGVALIILS